MRNEPLATIFSVMRRIARYVHDQAALLTTHAMRHKAYFETVNQTNVLNYGLADLRVGRGSWQRWQTQDCRERSHLSWAQRAPHSWHSRSGLRA
jgi:hypothetical protein